MASEGAVAEARMSFGRLVGDCLVDDCLDDDLDDMMIMLIVLIEG